MTSDSERQVALWTAYERLSHSYIVRDEAAVLEELATIDRLRGEGISSAGPSDVEVHRPANATTATTPSMGQSLPRRSPQRERAEAIDELYHQYRTTHEPSLRMRLVEAHRGMAASIAHDYRGRGIDLDDLIQIAMLGVLEAVDRFDPESDIPFSSIARQIVNSNIKRSVRDRTFAVRQSRTAEESDGILRLASAALTSHQEHPPTMAELAEELDISEAEVQKAQEAGAEYGATVLESGQTDSEHGASSAELSGLLDERIQTLPTREAEVLRLRFYEDLTQSEIADRLGVSQMHVSRIIRRCLLELREGLDG